MKFRAILREQDMKFNSPVNLKMYKGEKTESKGEKTITGKACFFIADFLHAHMYSIALQLVLKDSGEPMKYNG